MKLSDLLKALYEASEFTSVPSLAENTGIAKSFIERSFYGINTMEKLDVLFEALTGDMDREELMLAIEMVNQIKSQLKIKDQIL